jgi:predicted neuraminidase
VGAAGWTDPEIVQDTPDIPDGNSVLHVGEDGALTLFYALQVNFEWPTAVIYTRRSTDDGYTWAPPTTLGTPPGYLPRTHLLTLDNGWIIFPLYVEYTASSVALRSEDGGETWKGPSTILDFLGTQPTVMQRSDGSLFALMRSGAPPQKSWRARSTNRGVSWTGRALSGLSNPGSSLEIIMLASGNAVVVFNNSTDSRANLSLGISTDEGASWDAFRAIEDHESGSYSYPSMIQDRCGVIHVTYSFEDRQTIAHFVLDEDWIDSK